MFIHCFLFLILHLLRLSSQKYLRINYRNIFGNYYISASFGGKQKEILLTFTIGQNLQYAGIHNYTFISYDVISPQTTIQKQDSLPPIPVVAANIYIFLDNTPCFYTTYIMTNRSSEYESFDSFPFAFQFTNTSFSLTHNLKSQGWIDSLSYTLSPKNTIGGAWYFGSLPQNETEGKYKSSCDVNKNYISWGCDVKTMKIRLNNNSEDYTYYFNGYGYFLADQYKINVPRRWYSYLNETIFNKYYEDMSCLYWIIQYNHYICCTKAVIDNFKDLSFEIGGHYYSVPKAFLFGDAPMTNRGNTKYYDLRVIYNTFKDIESIIFGTLFTKEFTMEFNYDLEKIIFFSWTGVEKSQGERGGFIRARKIMLLVNSVLILFNILALWGVRFKYVW